MQSKATTVAEYLAELPADRRVAIEAVRKVILKNLDSGFEEGMQYGMIGYFVPHRIYPPGYHCDPKQGLSYAGLASQKQHMSIYIMCLYASSGAGSEGQKLYHWFTDAWKRTGKKLDMGKSCIRFKKLDDLALDVFGELIRKVPADKYIAFYEAAMAANQARKNAVKKKREKKASK
jgi:hypothetical protein